MPDEQDGPQAHAGGLDTRIPADGCTLELSDPAGATILAGSGRDEPGPLGQAIEQSESESGAQDARRRKAPEVVEGAVEDAAQVIGKVERATALCREVLAGQTDLKTIGNEVDGLLGLLGRLDRAGRWHEALQVARCLSTLLGLASRWIELLRSLRAALHAAEQLGDRDGQGWAAHELGTLYLAAGRHADADRLLSRAQKMRKDAGDLHGLALTERNLQTLCKTLRQSLHDPASQESRQTGNSYDKVLRRPVFVLVCAIALLLIGGTAGAVFMGRQPAGVAGKPVASTETSTVAKRLHSRKPTPPPGSSKGTGPANTPAAGERVDQPHAKFSFQPVSPVAGELVSFDATPSLDRRAPITSYAWSFGDGQTGVGRKLTHVYEKAGDYQATLTIVDGRGAKGESASTIAVASRAEQPSQITVECPQGSVVPNQEVSISGSITPPQGGATVILTFTGPSERSTSGQATTDSQGAYRTAFTPPESGKWSVQARWEGNSARSAATSESCAFLAARPPQ